MIILPSLEIVPAKYNTSTNTLLSQIPIDGTGDFTVSRTTSPVTGQSTRVNALGQIELVADNVPRLDYFASGGTVGCPALLVEPSGSNLLLQSAGFEVSGTWSPTNNTITTGSTAAFTAPDNSTNADLITASISGATGIGQNTTIASGTYTLSVFAKAGNYGLFRIGNVSSAARAAWFNLNAGVVTGIVNGGTASMQNYGNGWYRCIYTSSGMVSGNTFFALSDAPNSTNSVSGSSIYFWGAQLETGSVATSYIPTTTGSVTRNADVVAVSGAVSGSIGQTEGTIYAEVVLSRVNANQIISLGSTNDRIAIFFDSSTGIYALIRVGATNADYNATIPAIPATGGVYKIALAYKANDYCFAVNGVAYNPSTASRGVPANMSAVYLGASVFSTGQLNDRIRAAALYTTRLTNAQLAALTSP